MRKQKSSRTKVGSLRLFAFGMLIMLVVIIGDVLFRDGISRQSDLVFDAFQRTQPRTATLDPGVVVVDIDEASLVRLGQWPWPRDRVGDLVDRLGVQGAAVIAFDVVFTESDRTSLSAQLERMQARGITLAGSVAAEVLDNDLAFSQAIARHPVVMGVALTNETGLPVTAPPAGLSFAGSDPRHFLPAFRGGLSHLPVLTEAASGIGSFSFVPAVDNIIRSMPLVAVANDEVYPGLGVEALRVAQGASGLLLRSSDASGEAVTEEPVLTDLRVGVLDVPVGPAGQFRMHYSGMPHMTTLPAWQVLEEPEGRFSEQLEGRIVLVGTSAIGLRDIVATPLSAAEPGVNVHAELVDQILNQAYLNRPDWARGAEVLLALVLGMVLLLVLGGGRPVVSSSVFLLLSAGVMAGSWWAYRQQQMLLDPLPALLVLTLMFLVMLPMLLFMGNRERRFVRDAFGRYLSPTLVERLSQDAGALKLGGEERPITVMFSDIRGFTTLSENLSPTELTELLNGFLTPMTDVLLTHEATIDKYIGDAIMAFWNAPLDIAGHPRKACLGALAMANAVVVMNNVKGTALRIGVGLHTGDACVGNLGSQQRFSYSAIGDTVNLASRVEGLTKYYGVTIMVTDAVRAQAEGLAFAEVDRVRVVGRNAPVALYALLGDAAWLAEEGHAQQLERHAHFVQAYQRGEFEQALALLPALAERGIGELSGLYETYRVRLQGLIAQPPTHWDGVYTATSKG